VQKPVGTTTLRLSLLPVVCSLGESAAQALWRPQVRTTGSESNGGRRAGNLPLPAWCSVPSVAEHLSICILTHTHTHTLPPSSAASASASPPELRSVAVPRRHRRDSSAGKEGWTGGRREGKGRERGREEGRRVSVRDCSVLSSPSLPARRWPEALACGEPATESSQPAKTPRRGPTRPLYPNTSVMFARSAPCVRSHLALSSLTACCVRSIGPRAPAHPPPPPNLCGRRAAGCTNDHSSDREHATADMAPSATAQNKSRQLAMHPLLLCRTGESWR
jgi:hypothetical protein